MAVTARVHPKIKRGGVNSSFPEPAERRQASPPGRPSSGSAGGCREARPAAAGRGREPSGGAAAGGRSDGVFRREDPLGLRKRLEALASTEGRADNQNPRRLAKPLETTGRRCRWRTCPAGSSARRPGSRRRARPRWRFLAIHVYSAVSVVGTAAARSRLVRQPSPRRRPLPPKPRPAPEAGGCGEGVPEAGPRSSEAACCCWPASGSPERSRPPAPRGRVRTGLRVVVPKQRKPGDGGFVRGNGSATGRGAGREAPRVPPVPVTPSRGRWQERRLEDSEGKAVQQVGTPPGTAEARAGLGAAACAGGRGSSSPRPPPSSPQAAPGQRAPPGHRPAGRSVALPRPPPSGWRACRLPSASIDPCLSPRWQQRRGPARRLPGATRTKLASAPGPPFSVTIVTGLGNAGTPGGLGPRPVPRREPPAFPPPALWVFSRQPSTYSRGVLDPAPP